MSWSKLDPSVIDSEVCIECGRCCKRTQLIGVASNRKYSDQIIDYVNIVYDDMPNKKWVTRDRKDGKKAVYLQKYCPHLEVDDKYKKCGLWQDPRRPKICGDYNCIDAANHSGKAPQDWKEIKALIISKGHKITKLAEK